MAVDVVISADSHIVEPLNLWHNILGDKYGDATPRAVEDHMGVPGTYFFSGIEFIKADEIVEGSTPEMKEKLRQAGFDPTVRLQCMEEDGVWGRSATRPSCSTPCGPRTRNSCATAAPSITDGSPIT